MKWTTEAENAVKKVPFFVRKKVRTRVETEAEQAGKSIVTIDDVHATKARYLSGMESQIQGYRLDACFGSDGCPNRILDSSAMLQQLEHLLSQEDLLGFLKSQVQGPLKFHHEFTLTLADCPNACSQPQIRDIGIIGALFPEVSPHGCSHCEECVQQCTEAALSWQDSQESPEIDLTRCVGCGQCVQVCPSETLKTGRMGYRVLLGGKLGRHPRLAVELPGIFSQDQVMTIVRKCLAFYKSHSRNGKRFSALIQDMDETELGRRFLP